MAAKIGRLALTFTDDDLVDHANVRMRSGAAHYTKTIALPSAGGIAGAYYNGGDLDGGNTSTFSQPHDSLIMALAAVLAPPVGGIVVTEDPLLPGRYVLTAGFADWEILWSDPLTTADPRWFGFADRRSTSGAAGDITADYQADRLFIARHPRWNRKKRVRVASVTQGYSDSAVPQVRQYGSGHKPWSLAFSMVAGARFYKWDAEDPALGEHVVGAVAGAIAVSATVDGLSVGYVVGDKLTLVGGTCGAAAIFNVDSVNVGIVLTMSPDDTDGDIYTVKPVNPCSTTGPGATDPDINVIWEDGDQNVCLEEFWEWVTKRLPIKVIEDAERLTEYAFAHPRDPAWLNDLDEAILRERSEAPPYYDIALPLQETGS